MKQISFPFDRKYHLDRYHDGGLMAQGATVVADSAVQAIEMGHKLFPECEYARDVFKINRIVDIEV